MYQTLYRKYRPTNLDDVVGQKTIVRTLKNSIVNDRISHAYLFCGPRGTGKTSIAKILAKTINCVSLETTNPCNKCINCVQNTKNSIDIIEIDAASNNGVDEIRELKSKINLVPSLNRYKVYIIDEVHMLTTGAFNALLKTLEEPPNYIIFILATTEPHKIPTTILSRCQRFDFKRIPNKDIISRLEYVCKEEDISIDNECLCEIARLSNGGLRDSLSMLDQLIAYCDDNITVNDIHEINSTVMADEIKNFVLNISNNNIQYVLEKIDNYNDCGKDFIKLSEELIEYLKNLLIKYVTPNYFDKLNLKKEFYDINIDRNKVIKIIEKLNMQISKMKISNNPKLIFEISLIEIIDDDNNKIINSDIKKIEEKKKKNIENDNNNIEKDVSIKENKLEKLKKIRINNTLCKFNKKEFVTIKQKLEKINELLIDPEYCEVAAIVLDGKIKAAGNNNLIFVYKNDCDTNNFNTNILKIEKMLNYLLDDNYNVIATDESDWDNIKNEFNKKIKKYEYIEEPKELLINLNTNNNVIDTTFGNIVDYN